MRGAFKTSLLGTIVVLALVGSHGCATTGDLWQLDFWHKKKKDEDDESTWDQAKPFVIGGGILVGLLAVLGIARSAKQLIGGSEAAVRLLPAAGGL